MIFAARYRPENRGDTIIILEKSVPRSNKWERAMKSAYEGLSRLEENPPETISELRTLEANCAASYFCSWVGMPIKWRGVSRRPIPDNWRSIGVRSSPYHLAGNRNAAHPVGRRLRRAMTLAESRIRVRNAEIRTTRKMCRLGYGLHGAIPRAKAQWFSMSRTNIWSGWIRRP
jgi:hypothetical protein